MHLTDPALAELNNSTLATLRNPTAAFDSLIFDPDSLSNTDPLLDQALLGWDKSADGFNDQFRSNIKLIPSSPASELDDGCPRLPAFPSSSSIPSPSPPLVIPWKRDLAKVIDDNILPSNKRRVRYKKVHLDL